MFLPAIRSHFVFAPTTEIGKTVITSILLRSALIQHKESPLYIKPVGTFEPTGQGDDQIHIKRFVGDGVITKSLWKFGEPVSPHLAKDRLKDGEGI
jgi:bifunctional dethiobiotin synthetase / adenosylmethionine---8-amino-7-oxononanoate aminotransferase